MIKRTDFMQNEKFKFSVVIPIYNVEQYLEDTIESVLAQDIGFRENIQMILVNDGSPDNSEQICLEYQRQYPDNIVYVKQENAGVSAARNHGMSFVEGRYVNFLDSDDKWSPDAFSEVYKFFEQHREEISLVSCKQEFFEARSGLHILSRNKFECNRIIDVLEDYEDIQLHITSSFVKASAMSMVQFDTNLKYGEDAVYVNEIILDTHKYGVVSAPTHYYRKRSNNTSAVQGKGKALDWYFVTPRLFYQRLIDISLEKWGEVIPYVQYAVAYDIRWRLKDKIQEVLTEEQRKRYIQIMRDLLQKCDDDIILMQKGISIWEKWYLLSLKYKEDIFKQLEYLDGKMLWNNLFFYNFQTGGMLRADVISVRNGRLLISGQIRIPFIDDLEFWVRDVDGKEYLIEKKRSGHSPLDIWGTHLQDTYVYEVSLPLRQQGYFEFYARYQECYLFNMRMIPGKFARLTDKYEASYFVQGGYILTYIRERLNYELENATLIRQKEKAFQLELKHILDETADGEERKDAIRKALKFRKKYFWRRRFLKHRIWLVSDRINIAGDNGEAFFRYLTQHSQKGIKPYFVISEQSEDYERMKKIGSVLPYGSDRHKLYTLLADKIISSQAEDNVCNPFYDMKCFVGDLFHYDYVFLQHGITKNNLSAWLNKYNKNIRLFVTAAYSEYEAILTDDYQYDASVVKLIGFPRYDYLMQDIPCKKYIIFMPTWRRNLAIEMDAQTGERPYNPAFRSSAYYRFYENLINDERILEVLRQNGYNGKFCIHNNNKANAMDFHGNELIEIVAGKINYQKEFKEAALLITDYSSVEYDFAYLKKPVIYAQFDRDEFYNEAVYDKGYWDYEKMGFGPVCRDYESTIQEIISMIQNGCKMEEKYLARAKEFYFKMDRNNCRRVCEAIREIGNTGEKHGQ